MDFGRILNSSMGTTVYWNYFKIIIGLVFPPPPPRPCSLKSKTEKYYSGLLIIWQKVLRNYRISMRMSHYPAENVYHMAHFAIFHEKISQITLAFNRFATKLHISEACALSLQWLVSNFANWKVNLSSWYCNFGFYNNNFPKRCSLILN